MKSSFIFSWLERGSYTIIYSTLYSDEYLVHMVEMEELDQG